MGCPPSFHSLLEERIKKAQEAKEAKEAQVLIELGNVAALSPEGRVICHARASSSHPPTHLPTWTFVLGVVPSPSLTPGDARVTRWLKKRGGLFMQGSAAMSISAFGRGWFIAAVSVWMGLEGGQAQAPRIEPLHNGA